ncbi:MAG TPA: AAA family ATPase [Chthoniobacterales bacterium]
MNLKTDILKTSRHARDANTEQARLAYETSSRTWVLEPVRAAFGPGPQHYCAADGPWDVKRLAETFSDQLERTWYSLREDAERGSGYWCELCIRLGERLFVRVDEDNLAVYASDPRTAVETVERLARTFRKAAEPRLPTFQIVKQSAGSIDTEAVRIGDDALLDSAALALHYGEDFPAWHEAFVDTLSTRHRGLSVLDGPPGTGKTSYLRQLMVRLKDTHRFYFLAAANLRLLRDAEFVDFWSSERRLHEDASMVVILEDSENALMPRRSDNREEVSLLLSITDGILGEFLRLQVICTINCQARELDPALLRPGRLVAHRHFGRMNRARAERLAVSLGRPLPAGDDFSLAEIFRGERAATPEKRTIGFG